MITYMQLGDALSDEFIKSKNKAFWSELSHDQKEEFVRLIHITAIALKRNGFLIDEENQVKLN